MSLTSVRITNLRLFSQVEFNPSSRLNIIAGDNAAGKTSLLEAIHLLATARSFRCHQVLELLKHNTEQMRVVGQLTTLSGKQIPLGLQKDRKTTLMKADGKRLNKVSELASWLPIQAIHPESHQLIAGGPKMRRQFLDWGVFHVEHSFISVWKRYDRVLRQRNSALRQPNLGMDAAWDVELSESAQDLHRIRLAYLDKLQQLLPKFTQIIAGEHDCTVDYQAGWNLDELFETQLKASLDRDKSRGFTHLGPHRAELVFKLDGRRVQQHVSRGQQKMLVYALSLAQIQLLTEQTDKTCILLMDDLPAELDTVHRDRLLELLQDMNVQVFVTAIDEKLLNTEKWPEKKMFHVEQGQLQEI